MPPYDAALESSADASLLAASAATSTGSSPQPPAIPATDGELLLLFTKHRDQAAFARLVDRHAALVWSACQQVLGNRADVEDAFQATFLILARCARSIRTTDSAAGWLYRVAHRTAMRLWRDRRKRKAVSLEGRNVIGPEINPLERLSDQHAVTVLIEELRALPERFQSPLVLCYLEGLSRSAAAEVLDCTTVAVKGRLARGRRMLRQRLARRGVALSVAAAAAATGVAAAKPVVASTTLGTATASAASSFVSTGSGGTAAIVPHVSSLAQQGASAMFFATLVKPALAAVGVLTVGIATALAASNDNTTTPPASSGFALQASSEAPDEEGNEFDAALSTGRSLAPSPVEENTTDQAASRDAQVVEPLDPMPRPPQPVQMDFAQTQSGEDIMVLRGDQQSVLAAQQRAMEMFANQPQPAPSSFGPPQQEPSDEALKLAQKHWELRAKGLRAKANAIKRRIERLRALDESGTIPASELADADEDLADAILLEADAYLAEAKGMELARETKQQKQNRQRHPILPPTPVAPPQPANAPSRRGSFGQPPATPQPDTGFRPPARAPAARNATSPLSDTSPGRQQSGYFQRERDSRATNTNQQAGRSTGTTTSRSQPGRIVRNSFAQPQIELRSSPATPAVASWPVPHQINRALPALSPQPTQSGLPGDDTPLQPGDYVQVSIHQNWPIPSQVAHSVQIGEGGHLSIAGLNEAIQVVGLSLDEATTAVNEALAEQHGEKLQHVGLEANVRRLPPPARYGDLSGYVGGAIVPTTGPDGRPNPAAYATPQPALRPTPQASPSTPRYAPADFDRLPRN